MKMNKKPGEMLRLLKKKNENEKLVVARPF